MCFLLLKIIYISICITVISNTTILTVASTRLIHFIRTNSPIFLIYIIVASINSTHRTRSTSTNIIFIICIRIITANIPSILIVTSIRFIYSMRTSNTIPFIYVIVASTSLICLNCTTSTNIIFIICITIFIFISVSKKLAYVFFIFKNNTQ